MASINDDLLCEFANQFFGYGTYHGPVWFVGMEEGGGNSIDEVNAKISLWESRGKREVEDLAGFHLEMGKPRFFDGRPKLQPTWGKLIQVLFGMEGVSPTRVQVREFQATHLGRAGADHCLLELLPLPSPSTKKWLYGEYAKLDFLADRATYRDFVVPRRTKHLRQRIAEYAPKVVVFYGMSYRNYWQLITEARFSETADSTFFGRRDSTLFAVTKHPAAFGAGNEYFRTFGRLITAQL